MDDRTGEIHELTGAQMHELQRQRHLRGIPDPHGVFVGPGPATDFASEGIDALQAKLLAAQGQQVVGAGRGTPIRDPAALAKSLVDKIIGEQPERMIPLRCDPRPDCPKCHGRGHTGKNEHDRYVPCSCCA